MTTACTVCSRSLPAAVAPASSRQRLHRHSLRLQSPRQQHLRVRALLIFTAFDALQPVEPHLRILCYGTQRHADGQVPPLRPLTIDWASEDTWFAIGAGILGISVGIGAPAAYVLLQQSDEKKLEELRELNRQSYKETGQYMSEVTSQPNQQWATCLDIATFQVW